VFIQTFCSTAQGLDSEPVYLPDEFLYHRFKLLNDTRGLSELPVSGKILQRTDEIASGRRKLRNHATAFVGRFAQARRVLITERVAERGKMIWDTRGERLTHFAEHH